MSGVRELWTFIWGWYNLPFTLSLVVCTFLSVLQFIGWVGDEFDLDGDADADGDMDADADADGDGDGPFHSFTTLTDFLGVGRVPLTLLLLLFSASFGLIGWLLNMAWLDLAALPASPLLLIVWPVALVLSVLLTSRLGRGVARLLPPLTTTATSKEQLVGRVARVISPQVDDSYGQVRLRDAAGTLITVFAVTIRDTSPITRDTEVVLLEFDPQRRRYTVAPLLEG